MRRFPARILVLLLAWGAGSVQASTLLWDNFLTPNPETDGGFDGQTYITDERNALVGSSWAIDDMVFETDVVIEELRWAGGRTPAYDPTYSVEVLLLNSDFTPVGGGSPFEPTFAIDGVNVVGNYGTYFGYQAFNGSVALPTTALPAGRYYVGVRLASADGAGFGRHVMLSTGNGTINGDSMAQVYVPLVGLTSWTPIADFPFEEATDLAFQVYGVPEPAAFLLLACVTLLRRR